MGAIRRCDWSKGRVPGGSGNGGQRAAAQRTAGTSSEHNVSQQQEHAMHAEMAPDAPFAMLRPASCDAATGAVALGAAAILRGVAAPRPTVLIKRALARATFVRLAACGRDLQPLSILEIVCLLAGEEEPLPAACCPLPAPQNRPEGGWANRVAAHHPREWADHYHNIDKRNSSACTDGCSRAGVPSYKCRASANPSDPGTALLQLSVTWTHPLSGRTHFQQYMIYGTSLYARLSLLCIRYRPACT